jgi:cell division protein FtsN
MDKDYKDRVPGRSSGEQQAPPGWLWFGTGVLAGGFFAGLVCLAMGGLDTASETGAGDPAPKTVKVEPKEPPPEQKPAPVSTPEKEAQAKPDEKAAAATKPEPKPSVPEPRFDFYTILPEKEEVITSKRQDAGRATRPTPPVTSRLPDEPFRQTAPPRDGEPKYMLQLGSFKRIEDAERRRAEFGMLSIPTEIQTVTIKDGEVYHRVRSGPYSSEDAGLLGDRLSDMDINSLTIRLRDQAPQ